jgi:hypothetical protein
MEAANMAGSFQHVMMPRKDVLDCVLEISKILNEFTNTLLQQAVQENY